MLTRARIQMRRLIAGGTLRELRRLRRDLSQLQAAVTRIADAMEAHNAYMWPHQTPGPAAVADAAPVMVTYTTDAQQRELMDIELELLQATGRPPTEDSVLAEYDRRHPGVL